jgi:tRNA(Ile)-lysidine synthase
VRHNLMPVLETVHPQAQKHIAQLAQHVSLEEEYWTDEVNKILRGATFSAEEVRVPYADLAQLHPALRLRVLRAALGRVRGDLLGLKSRHLHALDSIFSSSRPQMQFDLPGAWVARRYAEVVFRRTPPHCCASDYLIPLDGPGTYPLPDGSKVVVEICAQVRGENHFCLELEGDKVIWPLYIRNNRRGDRVKCVGMAGSKKLKDLFSERHIILERRKSVPLLCNAQGEILWVIGIRRSRLWHCTPRSHRVVRVVFTPAGSKI